MVTNTPVGVLAAIVILPSCLDFTVVHRLLRQTSTCRDNGLNQFRDRRLCLDHGQLGSNPLGSLMSHRKGPPGWRKGLPQAEHTRNADEGITDDKIIASGTGRLPSGASG